MARIICLGSALQDVYMRDRQDFGGVSVDGRKVLGKLELGDKVDIDEVEFSIGGGGTNIAVGLSRGGHKVFFIGTVAHDTPGSAVVETLLKEKVNIDYLNFVRDAKTGYSVVLLAPSGERTILTYRGASQDFLGVSLRDFRTIKPDWLSVTTTYGNMELLKELFGYCAERGIKIMWNPGKLELKHRERVMELVSKVNVLLLNKKEAGLLLGEELSAREAAEKLDQVVDIAVVTDASRGLVGAWNGKLYKLGLYEDVKVMDTTGAGDAFGSGFLTEFAHTGDFKKALIYGAANSTSVVQKIGAKAGLLRRRGIKIKNMKVKEL